MKRSYPNLKDKETQEAVKTAFERNYQLTDYLNVLHSSGSTRPSNPPTGALFFDSTLGKPIYWSGKAWVDSTGTAV